MRSQEMKKSCINSLLALVVTFASGCAVHQAPYLAYSDKNTPLRNTAVLVAWDNSDPRSSGADMIGIKEIDNTSMSTLHSYPFWARVLPGNHTFILNYHADSSMSGFKFANIKITVSDMKAGHTYKVIYRREGNTVGARVEDLGQNANFGMPICGMYGDCKTPHRVKFE